MICYVTIFLTDSKEFHFVVTYISDWSTVSIDVPQGSILGPLLLLCISMTYLLLLNNLYADNAEMHCSHSDLHAVEPYLQSDPLNSRGN